MGARPSIEKFGSVVRPLFATVAAFIISALQSLVCLNHAPDVGLAVALGVPFAAGLSLGWRAILPVTVGATLWLLIGKPDDGWLALPAVPVESVLGACLASWIGPRPLVGGLISALVRGAVIGGAFAASGHDAWLSATVMTITLGFPANAILGLAVLNRVRDQGRLDLLESAVVHARDSVIVLEATPSKGPGRAVLYVNESFTRMTGYTADEVVGRSLHFLRGPRSCPLTLGRIRDALDSATPLQIELLNYRKDGTELWVELSLVPVRDNRGLCRHWVMIQRDASDRKRAEEELREREQRIRDLGDNLPDGAVCQVIAEPGGLPRFTYVSAGIKRLTGRDAAELLADPDTAHSFVHPDDKPRFFAAGEMSERNLTPFDCIFRVVQPDGVKWVHCRSMPQRLSNGGTLWNGVMLDVTTARLATDALKQNEELFRGMFENAAAGVSVLDNDGVLASANPAFLTLLGRHVCEVIGHSPQEFTHPEDWPAQAALWREVMAGERDGYQLRKRYLRPDGSIVWAELSVAVVRGHNGECVRTIGVTVDMTDRRRLEEQLRHIQKIEAVGQMAGGIAHDFNNLLTGVIGNLDLVQLPRGDQNAELIGVAMTAAQRAAELTRKLLGFARKNQLVIAPIRVGDFVREVVDILGRTFDPRIRIITDLTAPDLVLADATLVNQAVLNLCLNARDAMPVGGTLTIQASAVHIDAEEASLRPDARAGLFVRLSVSDTGHGMTPEVRARIFEPFFTTKPIGQGTGLGLPMVHGIVQQHSGWVECETTPGHGTRFDLYLPGAVMPPTPPTRLHDRATPTPPDVTTPAPVGSRTVLLVDDEAMIRCLGRSVLEQEGFRVLEAQDGADAVDLFRREHNHIDLVILDLTMPRLSGRDAFRSMTAIAPYARVLFSSGYSSDDLSDVSGAVGLLAKPYRPQELISAVRRALNKQPELPSPAS